MFKTSILATAAAAAALFASSAFAAVESNTFFVPPTFGPGMTQYFTFSNTAEGLDRVAGDSFIDDFIFNTPPASALVDFTAMVDFAKLPMPGLLFTGFSLTSVTDGTTFTFPGAVTSTMFVSGGNGLLLDSGTYDLRITGTILANGATYNGAIQATVPVPEPETWALSLAGLLAVGAIARRRKA